MLMTLYPTIYIVFCMSFLVCSYAAFHIGKAYLKNKNRSLGYFTGFFVFKALKFASWLVSFSFLFWFPEVNPAFKTFFFGLALSFLAFAIAVALPLFFSIKFPKLERLILIGALTLSLIISILALTNINYPVFNLEANTVIFTIPPMVGIGIAILLVLAAIVVIPFFFYEATKTQIRAIRNRSLLLGTGFSLAVICGVILLIIPYNYWLFLLIDIIHTIGYGFIFLGIIYKISEPLTVNPPQNIQV